MSSSGSTSSTGTASSSSADLPAGAVVAGFRLERVIGRGSRATVYEATQLSLDRRVAFKLLHDPAAAERVRRLRWPDHPGAVSLFGAGDSEHGPWIAMRLVKGGTLATRRAPLDQVATALAAAHAAGIAHGSVTPGNILVADGRAYLSDFGLAPGEPSLAADREAMARLLREHAPGRRRARRLLAAGAAMVAAAAGVVVLAAVDGPEGEAHEHPPAPSGTRPLGSPLEPGGVESVDCTGRPPGGTSPSCTISQRTLADRPVVVPADGTITSWAVRGARGTLALQVLRPRGDGLLDVGRSAEATIPDGGPHLVRTRLAVAAGDRVALLVAPESAIGIRRATPGATVERWLGPLLEPPRPPERPAGTGFDHELLLRVDLSPEDGVEPIERVVGAAAGGLEPGRVLGSCDVAIGGGGTRTVTVVVLGGGVALDLLDGPRRLARVPVAGANGRGRLQAMRSEAGTVRVRWRNSDGRSVVRRFAVTRAGLGPRSPTS